jgi:hypothetical protein
MPDAYGYGYGCRVPAADAGACTWHLELRLKTKNYKKKPASASPGPARTQNTRGLSPRRRPAPPARGTEEGQMSHQPRRRRRCGATGHRTQGPSWNPRTTGHTKPRPAPPWTQRVPGGVKFRLLASLIAQLVHRRCCMSRSSCSCGFNCHQVVSSRQLLLLLRSVKRVPPGLKSAT